MRAFVALLRDSYRQAVDQKAILILLVISSLFAVWYATLKIERRPAKAMAARLVAGLERVTRVRVGSYSSVSHGDPAPAVESVTGPDATGRISFAVTFKNRDPLAGAVEERAHRRRHSREPPDIRPPEQVPDAEVLAYLHRRFQERGASSVEVEPLAAPPGAGPRTRRYRVTLAAQELSRTRGATKVSFLFGLINTDVKQSLPRFLYEFELGLVDIFAGRLGMFIALIVTAGFLPYILRKGRVDFLLSRPLSRGRLLLAKYFGGLIFVLLMAGVLVAGLYLARCFAVGVGTPFILLTVPCLVYYFAMLYGFSTLMGVLTRSAVATIFFTFLFWTACAGVNQLQLMARMSPDSFSDTVRTALDAAYTVLPKTTDLGHINHYLIARDHLTPKMAAALLPEVLAETNYLESILTSGLFTGVLLFLAWLRLRRRDF